MKKAGLPIFLGSILLIFFAFLFRESLSQFKSLGLLGIFLINFIGSATLFFPIPAIASVVAGGVVYPPFLVGVTSAFGASAGDLIGFLLGHSSREIFIKNHNAWYKILRDLFHKFGILIILIFAFIPNPLFDIVGISAGLFKFPLIRFFALVFLGRLIRNLLLASLSSLF